MEIRAARESEATELSALAMAAKSHWGYAKELLQAWRSQLTITREEIRCRPTFVITAQGTMAGFYSLEPDDEAWRLEHFWVRPEFIGRGIGRRLLRHALQTARTGGAAHVTVYADPNAATFYLRCGAMKLGDVPAPIPGETARVRPQLRFHLHAPQAIMAPLNKARSSPLRKPAPAESLPKAPTGIAGLDEITYGGLPRGRPTLVCGGAGSGKTLFAMEFLLRGAIQFDEPGVFMAFEETEQDLAQNVRSLGFDVEDLIMKKKLAIDYVHIERSEIEETGAYDLEGLFVRLGAAIDEVGAKRVVLDTLESLFSGFSNPAILRAELRRLFRWLKDRGVTAVITGERGEGTLTRQGLDEYVSDCVILLDHRVIEQVSTRRLRIVKYRGTLHGTNEYPFLIDEHGMSVLPLTSLGLDHAASDERISAGVAGLDAMLGGKGYFRGSSIMISGTAGTGKSSLAAHFADAACRRGERCLLLAFEESPAQILRNMRSIGLDLEPWIDKGLLRIEASRPMLFGLEMHLGNL